MSDRPPLGRDEIANMAIRDAREIVGFLDGMDEITAGDEREHADRESYHSRHRSA
jgi:hypothetical protein